MEVLQMFPTNRHAGLFAARTQLRALETWRSAEQLVWMRWHAFLDAGPETRAWAFAAYVTALDQESAAASELAGTWTARAA
jgi:hypothetical protein